MAPRMTLTVSWRVGSLNVGWNLALAATVASSCWKVSMSLQLERSFSVICRWLLTTMSVQQSRAVLYNEIGTCIQVERSIRLMVA